MILVSLISRYRSSVVKVVQATPFGFSNSLLEATFILIIQGV